MGLGQWENNAENFTSTYTFEGYNIYIGSSSAGPWKRLATYDTQNELDIILQPTYDVNTGLILNMPAAYGNNLGLKYRYLFEKDYNDLTMANGHPYYILVTSYAYDPNSLPNVLESSFNVVTVTPHKPQPGTVYSNDALETVAINHVAGQADPRKYEIWVYVVDPLRVETADYKVIVNEDESWTLLKNNVEVPGYVNRTDNIIDKDIEHKSLLDDSLDFFFGVSLDFHEQQLTTYDPELISGNASILDGFTSPYRLNQASTDLAIDGQFKKGTRNPDYINNSLQI